MIIPNSVSSIGSWAFNGCSGLTSVTIPNSVASIGMGAFADCSGLTSISISNSVSSIDSETFRDCSSLTSVIIPNSVTSIGSAAFIGCSSLTSVTIGNSVTGIGYEAFSGCSGLTAVTLPNSVTSIEFNAFFDCTGLISVTIPNSVTNIGHWAFKGCSGLTSVHITDLAAWCKISFEDLLANPLDYAHHLYLNGEEVNNLVIPNSVTSINKYAFSSCSGLTSLTIPNSVTSIGNDAFSGCTSLMTITSYITEPFNISKFCETTYRKGTLYVPAGTKELYSRFDGWREFLNIVEMADGSETTLTIQDAQEGKLKMVVNTGERYTFQIMPASGWTIHCVNYNGEDVTASLGDGNWYTTPAITENAVLNISYEKGESSGAKATAVSRMKVRARASEIEVTGIGAGLPIRVYNSEGLLVGSALSGNGSTMMETTLRSGDIAIIRVEDKMVKMLMQ